MAVETLDRLRQEFKRQFAQRREISRDYILYALRPPESSPDWVVVVPGWISNPRQFKEALWELFWRGYRVLLVDSPIGVDTDPMDDLNQAYLRRAEALRRGMEQYQVESAWALTHSDGAITWAYCAHLLLRQRMPPQPFRAAVLIEPAGIIQVPTWRLLLRGAAEMWRNMKEYKAHPEDFPAWWPPDPGSLRGNSYHFLPPRFQWTARQGIAMGSIDIRPLLCGAVAGGVPAAILSGLRSKVFPFPELQAAFGRLHRPIVPVMPLAGASNWTLLINPSPVIEAAVNIFVALLTDEL